MKSIREIGNILERYTSEPMYAAYGYGAVSGQRNSSSECFALNGDIYSPESQRIEGIIDSYKKTVDMVELGFETKFSSVLNQFNGFSSAKPLNT